MPQHPHIPETFLDVAASSVALLADPAVARAWDDPSALRDFSVGGLAAHLANQILLVPRVLAGPVPAPDEEPAALLDHYAEVAWLDAGLDDEPNVGVRQRGEALAAGGAAALVARTAETLARLRHELAAEPIDRPVQVPWAARPLSLEDLLVTRIMELAVHSDDLAVSVGLPTPPLAPAAAETVIDLLTRLATRRHGPAAVIRALSRAERAPGTIAAF